MELKRATRLGAAQRSDEGGCGSNERQGWVCFERVTVMRVDGAQTGDEGGWLSNERREWMALERARRVDVA